MSIFKKASEYPGTIPYLDQDFYLINGDMRQWHGETRDVLSPVCTIENGEAKQMKLGSFPLMNDELAFEAVEAAHNAFNHGRGDWPTMHVEERIDAMLGFCNAFKEKRTETVNHIMWEIGKTQKDAETEFDRTVEYIQKTVDALKELDRASSRLVIEQGIVGQIRRAPLGVVLCMGPYNYPLNETYTTLIPALIMGNTIAFKPPKKGILLHAPLLELFQKFFPKGVVNSVYGSGEKVISTIMKGGKVDALAFIGSSKVADNLKKLHPMPHRMRSILGLDAKNPAIVLPDADLDLTIKEILLGTLSYNGQRCTALKILFVHRSIIDVFNKKLCAAVDALKAGLPWEAGTQITPSLSMDSVNYYNSLVKDALEKGARIINMPAPDEMTFFSPKVICPVTESMKLWREEQFGPIIPVVSYDNIEMPVNYIIESNFGQQLSIFGKNHKVIAEMIDPLVNQVCRVNLNCQCQRGPDSFPFTGRKDSAEGTLSISDALRAFSIRTLFAARENDTNRTIIKNILRDHESNFLNTDFIL